MKTARLITAFCVLFAPLDCRAGDISEAASTQVDRFLKGMRIAELPEGRKMIQDSLWPQWGNSPVLLEYQTVFEGMFDTDVHGVKGYKRMLSAKVKSEAGTPLEKRCLVVAYPRHRDGKWFVLVFSTGTDVDSQIAYGERNLGNTSYSKDQYNYRFVALWYASAGRLRDALSAYSRALELHRKDPAPDGKDSDFTIHIETIRAIIGDREHS